MVVVVAQDWGSSKDDDELMDAVEATTSASNRPRTGASNSQPASSLSTLTTGLPSIILPTTMSAPIIGAALSAGRQAAPTAVAVAAVERSLRPLQACREP
jgi:hypothetical protein